MVNEIKKSTITLIAVAVFSLTMLCGVAAASAAPAGPAPDSGDGIPSGNQFIQPETPGTGPAPNAGDGISDGSGF